MRDKTVAVLENRLGRQVAELVAKHGGRPLHAPALAEVPDLDRGAIAALVPGLEASPPRLAIFQTGVGTRALFGATDALGLTQRFVRVLDTVTIAVRGPKPTGALRARGLRIDLSAAEPYTTTEVLATLSGIDLAGAVVLVQRYGVTNSGLEEALKARGARVIEIPTYRWSLPADTAPLVGLIDALERHGVDAVAVTNAAQIHNLFELAGNLGRADALRRGLNATLIASVGPVSTGALEKHGVKVGLEASPPKLGPLIGALEAALSR
jgi:uroporphyrinogen-III synthase